MAFVVLYDACVLHPAPLRDLLVRIARTRIVRACWSDRILDECFTSIRRRRPDLDAASLARTRELLGTALPDACVIGYEHLVDGLDLPDPDDRHVLAAAIRANAQAIVTFNLRDFPDERLARYDIETKHPDEFVVDSIDLAPGPLLRVLTEQAGDLHHPAMTVERLIELLDALGLVRSAARFRELLSP